MATVNRNMFDATVTNDRPLGGSLMVLPLNLVASIVSYLDDPGDLARLCRTCRVLNYMSLPQLYKNLTLTSYDKIRYRGEEPEGMGSASPFSMGLNAVITRPYASLVRSLTLRGDWRELELEEHARVGRVPDSSMMMNIAVRAAIDRMPDLESFSWELSTKMLETVYLGLSQLPKLTSLTLRFPSSRHPRPTIVIPGMPHLRHLKVTDIDPLCYPDDISTLLHKCRKLRELKMHWSPRMRTAQEPSVVLHDYFRKCISAKQPLSVKSIALQNLYALHNEDFHLAFDQNCMESVTILNNNMSENFNYMNTFVDSTWPTNPRPNQIFRVKSVRQDAVSKRHADFLGVFTGLEKIYFVSATSNPSDDINCPRHFTTSGPALTPPSLDQSYSNSNSASSRSPDADATPSSNETWQASLRDTYLNVIITNHSSTLRHLLLPARWPLSASMIARIVHASPQLEQLAFATEFSSMDTLGLLLPFLRKLVALRVLVPTGGASSPQGSQRASKNAPGHQHKGGTFASARSHADIIEAEDHLIIEKLGESLSDQQIFSTLKLLGLGRKAFQLGEYYTIPATHEQNHVSQWQTPTDEHSAPDANGGQETSPSNGHNGTNYDDDSNSGILTPAITYMPACDGQLKSYQSPQILGKRSREDELILHEPREEKQFNPCLPSQVAIDGRLWRRRVRRVGWDVLKHWEIWGMDTQEL